MLARASQNKTMTTLIVLGLVWALWFSPNFAHAQIGSIEETLWGLVISFFGLFMGLAGWLLNVAINEFIIGFGDLYATGGVGLSVDTIWVSMRDIFNITFIFGLVYIGFKMILNSDDSNTRRWLIHLLMAALFVNFSLYFTKFVVDISNMTATQIATSGFEIDAATGDVMVSETYMDSIGLTSAFKPLKNQEAIKDRSGQYGFIFGVMMLFIVATFVFAAGGILIMIRFAVLLLYMVMSPFMFIGWVFPQLQRYTTQYWTGFLSRAFFAPLYLLILYFASQMLKSYRATLADPDIANALTTGGDDVQIGFISSFTPFILGCIFLVAAITIAQRMSDQGASGSLRVGQAVTNRTKRAVRSSMVNTAKGVGAVSGASAVAKRGSNAIGTSLDRQLTKLQALDRTNNRNVLTRGVGKLASMNAVDKAGRRGAATIRDAKFGYSTTHTQDQAYSNQVRDKAERSAELTQGSQTYQNAAAGAAGANDRRDAQNQMAAQVRLMTNDEIISMSRAQILEVAPHLSEAQMAARRNSGQDSNEQFEQIREARRDGVTAEVDAVLGDVASTAQELNDAFEDFGRNIRGLSNDRVVDLGFERLNTSRVAMNLTDAQLTHIEQSGAVTTSEMRQIRTTRDNALAAVASGNISPGPAVAGNPNDPGLVAAGNPNTPTQLNPADPNSPTLVESRRRALMNGNVQQVGQLPVAVFTEPDMAPYITPQALEQRMRNGRVTNADIATIRDNIDTHITTLIMNPAEQARVQNQWRTWAQRSPYGAQLGLTQI